MLGGETMLGTVLRIYEPVQVDTALMVAFDAAGISPGASVSMRRLGGEIVVERDGQRVTVSAAAAEHILLADVRSG